MAILVTGGAGFIGSNFVRHWLQAHPHDAIVVVDSLTYAGNRSSLPEEGIVFVKGDIRDTALIGDLLRSYAVETLVHFAAESHVDRSIHSPETFLETNVLGTLRLLEATRDYVSSTRTTPFRFHHVSTDEVYGSLDPNDSPFVETSPYAPNSPYAASKAASDHLVRAWHHTYGLPVSITNCSNNYGPTHFPEKLIPLMLVNILHGHPLPVYGDGLNIRDWLYVADHCEGIDLAINKGKVGEVYNLGGNSEATNLQIIHMLCKRVATEFANDPSLSTRFPAYREASDPARLITFVADRPGHDRRYAINAAKAESELGYRPKETLESGLNKTVRWYLDNEAWWRSVMDGSYREWVSVNYDER